MPSAMRFLPGRRSSSMRRSCSLGSRDRSPMNTHVRSGIQVAYSLVIVFGTGLVAEWVVRRLLARVMPRAPAPTRKRLAARLLLIGGALMIEALPVAVFAGTAIAALALSIPPFAMARYALSDLIEATIAVRLIIAVARAVLVPAYADDNLIPASEETRNYLLIWVRRF